MYLNENDILVSVVVLTYNSEKTIGDTLESIGNQTYKNIEIIITDDNSTDNTLEICKKWINTKKIKLLTSNVNTGVSANANRGWKQAKGKWIKTIAGDDILLNTCIKTNVDYILKNQNSKAVFSKMQYFSIENQEKKMFQITPTSFQEEFYQLSAEKQYCYLLTKSFNMAPTSFIRKDFLESIGYADENFKLLEDLPLWLKMTKNGEKLYYIPEITVNYRVGNSISRNKGKLVNLVFFETLNNFQEQKIYPEIRTKLMYYDLKKNYFLKKIIIKIFKNKKNRLSNILFRSVDILSLKFYCYQVQKINYILKKLK